jgi:hypothetical protein
MMFNLRRLRASPAMVVAFIALFVALGGSGYAVTRTLLPSGSAAKKKPGLPGNSVGTKQLKNGAVTGIKIKPGSVGPRNLNSAAKAALTGPKGDTGSTGPTGAQGQQGVQGGQGQPGAPGPSVAGFAVSRPGVGSLLPSDGSFGSTVTLNTGSSNSGPITVSFPARLIITGSVRLQNGDGSARTLSCRLVLNPGAGQQVVSPLLAQDASSFAQLGLTVAGAVNVAPGTYNVGMECSTGGANPNGIYSDVGLTVVAVGR